MPPTPPQPTLTVLQAFRSVSIQDDGSPTCSSLAVTINIRSRFDSRSGQQIILWNDIIKVFKHAEYVQHAGTFVPYLVNDDFEDIIPLRIAAHPGIVLEVVVAAPATLNHSAVDSSSTASSLSIQSNPLPTAPPAAPHRNDISAESAFSRTTRHLRESREYPTESGEILISFQPPPSYEQAFAEAIYNETDNLGAVSPSQGSVAPFLSSNDNLGLNSLSLGTPGANNASTANRVPVSTSSHASAPPSLPSVSETSLIRDLDPAPVPIPTANPSTRPLSHGRLQTLTGTNMQQEPTEETMTGIQAFLRTTRSLDWHEAPMPRLFIVLPTTCYSTDKSNPILDKFQFFWLCEFTNCNDGDEAGDHGIVPHLYHHSSLELVRPREFFEKYGNHLLQTMLMVKYGRGRWSRNTTATSGTAAPLFHSLEQWDFNCPQGIHVLQEASGLPQQDVELHLDLMICHLQRLTTTADYNNEATSQPQPPRELLPLQYDDLAQLQSFVVRRRTPITTADTDSGSPLLHRQYRVVNNQGHIQWICQFHIAQLYPTFDPEHVQRLFQGCYDYNPQNGQLVVFNRSTSFLSASHGPRILGTGCVSELTIDVRSGMSTKEFQSLRDAVVDFGLASLDIREFGYIAMSPLEVASPTSSPAANTADPYRRLQSYPSVSTVLWQLLSDHAIQSLSLRNASHLLAQDWARRPVCPFRLRRVWLTISTKGKGLNAVKQGILNILSHSPRLKDLKIVWDDLDEAIGEETLLKTLVAHASPDNKIKVSLAMAGWTTSLTIEKGQFVNASLRATNLAAVKQHSLALSGQLTGSLTITSMAIWGSTWPYILMYLSKNPRLASLDLQYPSEDFKKAEDVILEALLSGDNGPYHLRECILRDTRGKNDIRTRFTIPLSASLSVQRPMVSVSVAVDMVVVEKDSMDFDLFFSRYGHAVKSMVLARKTAPTLLASFDNATSTTIRTNPRSQLQFTNLVVSLTGMTTTSIFDLQRILERSKGTFKQLTLCGDVPPPSEFDDSMLLFHVLAGFVGEQVVLLKQSQGQGQGQGQATTMADQGRMQEWIDLVPFTLPKEAVFTVTEDKRDLCRIVSGLTMSIAEHL